MAVIFTALAVVIFKIDWVKIYVKLQYRLPYLPKIGNDDF
jgi:hypothetical protein